MCTVLVVLAALLGSTLTAGAAVATPAPVVTAPAVAAPTAALPQAPAAKPRPARLQLEVRVKQIAAGRGLKARVIAIFPTGRRQDVTKQARYLSSTPRVATASQGRIRSKVQGRTTIRAAFRGVRSGGAAIRVKPAVPVRVVTNPTSASIEAGESVNLRATRILSNNRRADVTSSVKWVSSAPAVARVNAGRVAGRTAGTARITGALGRLRSASSITVGDGDGPEPEPEVVGLQVSPDPLELEEGETQQLSAALLLDDGTTRPTTAPVSWESSSPAVGTVDGEGLFAAVAHGSTLVTATSGDQTGSLSVTVTGEADPSNLTIDPPTAEVEVGQDTQLSATLTFDDGSTQPATDAAVWTSSDPSLAAVAAGQVSGLAPGTVTITATIEGLSATALVGVNAPPPATPDRLEVTPTTATVQEGEETQLTAVLVDGEDGSSDDVTAEVDWSSDDDTVAAVDETGLVTGVAEGSAVVTATSGDLTGTSAITVTEVPVDRMEQALTNGEPDVVTEGELIAEARSLLAQRDNRSELIPTGPINWNPTNNSFRLESLATGYQVPILRGNTNVTGSGANRTLAAYGRSPSSTAALAFFALSPFSDPTTPSSQQPDAGMNQLARNVIAEMLGEPLADSTAKITLTNIRNSFEGSARTWLQRELPQSTVTPANSVCDWGSAQSETCLADTDLLVIGGDTPGSAIGGSNAAGRQAAAALAKQAHDNGIPVLFFADSFDTGAPTLDYARAFGMSAYTQYFQVNAVTNGSRQQQLDAGLDRVGDGYAEILGRISGDDPLAYADYSQCVKPAAGNGDLQGWTWQRCAGQPAGVADGVKPYLSALTEVRAELTADNAAVPFTGERTVDADLQRVLLLLADKARTGPAPSERPDENAVAIDYPLDLQDTDATARAVFADYVTSISWSGNSAPDDYGTVFCERPSVLADDCDAPTSVDVGSHDVTVAATADDEWKATGLSLVPGETATFTLAADPGFPVYVRAFYDRAATTRAMELKRDGASGYDRPQFLTTQWVRLRPGAPVPVTSPYGGPVYLRMDSSPASLGTEVSVNADGLGTHPTLLDANSQAQLDAFVAAFSAPERDWYADLSVGVAEVHVTAPLLDAGLQPYREAGRDVDYGGLAGLPRFLNDVRDAWVYNDYTLAGLKLPGQALTDTLPEEVQEVCADLGIPCTDEELNNRPEIQHANYGPASACGNLCSGNPLDSDGYPIPPGFGENHELGHNLQRKQLDVHWVDTQQGRAPGRANTWTNYTNRSGEVSNNIFPVNALSRYFRAQDDDPPLNRDLGGIGDFSIAQSLRSGLTRDGNLVALRPNATGTSCQIQASFPAGTDADTAISDSIWQRSGTYDDGELRLGFYVQIAQLAQGMELANGTELTDGWHLYTLLYAAARQFTQAASSQATWEAQREALGFGDLPYSGAAAYGGGNVSSMPGNDFLLVQLNRITGHDWSQVLTSYGVTSTSVAEQQATANAPAGGYTELGEVRRVIDKQMPYLDLADARTPLLDLADPATAWPGFDNNGNGVLTDPGDLQGFHPRACP